MKIEYIKPDEIEKRSFAIISEELDRRHIVLPEEQEAVTKRVIHTTADFDYARTLVYSAHAVEKALALLKKGADIVTDTNMAKAGIHKESLSRLGGSVYCWMADAEVAAEAKERGITRAAVSMERVMQQLSGPVILAVGNAPTALLAVHELMEQTKRQGREWRPDFVIGVPVGFVNVEAAKELFLHSDVPHIVNLGRKGGSNVAAAICNALIYKAAGR